MKIIIFSIILLYANIFSAKTFAQPSFYKDSVVVFDLLQKAEDYFVKADYTRALENCEAALLLSTQKKYTKGEAYSLIRKTDILIDKADYNAAEDIPPTVIKLANKINDSLVMGIGLLQTGQLSMYTHKLDAALGYFDKAIKLKLDRSGTSYAGLVWNDKGYTYGLMNEFDKQADCFVKALKIYEDNNDDAGMAIVLSNFSSLFSQLGEKTKAISYAKRAVEIREKMADYQTLSLSCCNLSQLYIGVDSAAVKKYQKLCVEYALRSNNERRIVHSYISAGLIASGQRSYKEAFEYETKAIDILEKNKVDERMLSRRYLSAAIVSGMARKDSVLSLNYFNKGITLASKLNDKNNLRDGNLHLAIFYKDRKDYYNAYENFKKYVRYKDSIDIEKSKADVAEIETKYETEKKDRQIYELNIAQRIRQLEIEKQKAIIAGNLFEAKQKENEIALLSKSKELQDILIGKQGEELERQSLLAANSRQQLKLAEQSRLLQQKELQRQKLLRNIIVGTVIVSLLLGGILFNRYQLKKKLEQQKELLSVRSHIAKDLHDDIGSALTSIKILSEVSKNNIHKDAGKATAFLEKITEQSVEMQQGMSDIIWAIKPDNDKLSDMLTRMREYVNHTLETKNITTVFDVDEAVPAQTIGMQQRRDFFLLFKEVINNAAKYSNAANVLIKLKKEGHHVLLHIEDDGVGFNASEKFSSNGLKNIQQRATALNGMLNIISSPGKGTQVSLTMPAT